MTFDPFPLKMDGQMGIEVKMDKIANISSNVLKRSFTANRHTAIHGLVIKTFVP